MLYFGTKWPYLCPGNPKKECTMFGIIITLALAALVIWLLVDSAVEFVNDSREDPLATEP